jgi:hypothetical protein
MSQSVDAFRTNCEIVPVNSCRDDPEAGRSLPNRAKGRSSRRLVTNPEFVIDELSELCAAGSMEHG